MIGYKKAAIYRKYKRKVEVIVKLEIPDDARIIEPYDRVFINRGTFTEYVFKYRTDKAKVLSITYINGHTIRDTDKVVSIFNNRFVYKKGKLVKSRLCCDKMKDCEQGIHFFKSRESAERYSL